MFQILSCSDLGTCCQDYALANILDIARRIFDLIQLIAPIALIVAATIQLAKLVANPEEKAGNKKILNKILAAAFIFFIPVFFNMSLGLFPEDFSIYACWEQAKVIREISNETKSSYVPLDDDRPVTKIVSNDKYSQGAKIVDKYGNIITGGKGSGSGGTSGGNSGANTINNVRTNGVLSWPVPGCTRISSTYGNRSAPVAGATTDHRAIDIACTSGTSVTAAYAGTVTIVKDGSNSDGYNGGRGYYIVLRHNINGATMHTEYQHLSQVLAKVGDNVQQGQVIAKSGGNPGSPGAGATSGAHLHFEVHNGNFAYHQNEVNPCPYLGLSKCYGDISSDLKK